jgi:hypothetical protein
VQQLFSRLIWKRTGVAKDKAEKLEIGENKEK